MKSHFGGFPPRKTDCFSLIMWFCPPRTQHTPTHSKSSTQDLINKSMEISGQEPHHTIGHTLSHHSSVYSNNQNHLHCYHQRKFTQTPVLSWNWKGVNVYKYNGHAQNIVWPLKCQPTLYIHPNTIWHLFCVANPT